MRPIRKYTTTITVSGGTGSATISGSSWRALTEANGYLIAELVKGLRRTDSFNFRLVDSDNYNILDVDSAKGNVNEVRRIPISDSSYRLEIHDAKKQDDTYADGTYNVKLILEEIW